MECVFLWDAGEHDFKVEDNSIVSFFNYFFYTFKESNEGLLKGGAGCNYYFFYVHIRSRRQRLGGEEESDYS